eukprot:6192779-Pleurochrysis_carterae.AAC.3
MGKVAASAARGGVETRRSMCPTPRLEASVVTQRTNCMRLSWIGRAVELPHLAKYTRAAFAVWLGCDERARVDRGEGQLPQPEADATVGRVLLAPELARRWKRKGRPREVLRAKAACKQGGNADCVKASRHVHEVGRQCSVERVA